VAVRFPRREPVHVAVVVDALPDAVDPSEAQRLVHRLGPGDARPARTPLVQPPPQVGRRGVMLVEPGAEGLAVGEEDGLHPRARTYASISSSSRSRPNESSWPPATTPPGPPRSARMLRT